MENDKNSPQGLKKLLEELRPPDPVSGFLLLFDIKDSTIRKRQNGDMWYHQTKIMYGLFNEFVENLCTETKLAKIVLKYSGDGLMTFLQVASEPQSPAETTAKLIFDRATTFVIETIYNEFAKSLDSMRLKSVLSYAKAHEVPYGIAGDKKDVIGNEIDLAFRLEKFADDTHFIVNDTFAQLLDKELQSYSTTGNSSTFKFIACNKHVKGFDAAQRFYALCNIENLCATVINKPYSPNRDDITEELLSFVAGQISTTSANDIAESYTSTFDIN
jgi:hypothetical protein